MGKPIYGHFTHTMHEVKWYISSFRNIFQNTVLRIIFTQIFFSETPVYTVIYSLSTHTQI